LARSDLLPEGPCQFPILLIEPHAAMAARDADFSQFAWLFDRQAAQADSIQQLEDGGIRADAQGQRQNSDEGKSRIETEQARAVA